MRLPKPRGPLSEQVFTELLDRPHSSPAPAADRADSPDDAALTLWALYELAYTGFDEVDDACEWDVELLRLRRDLEADLEARLRARWPGVPDYEGPLADALFAAIEAHDGPSLAAYVRSRASEEQVLDLLRLRTLYHLKEADPTSWVIPRLPAAPKAALVELQYDEYGGGRPEHVHSHLFVRGLEALGLRTDRGAYVDDVPLEVLEQNNAMSLFGLHRRLRGAALGHLAAFEATSSLPSRRMSQGLARLGLAPEMIAYYDEHVEADAVHEQMAMRAICEALVAEEPATEPDVWLGLFSCLDLEDRTAAALLTTWGEAA